MIKHVSSEEVLPLRSEVLRNHLPLDQCQFPTDQDGFHLGAYADDLLVSVATFFAENYPGKKGTGFRLRGMATSPVFAGRGYGAELVKFAMEELRSDNAAYIWCNARSSAVGFYRKLGFEVISEEFEVQGIGPHFNMLIEL